MKKLFVLFVVLLPCLLFAQPNPGNVGTTNLTAWLKADVLASGDVTSWGTSYPVGAFSLTPVTPAGPYAMATNMPTHAGSNYNTTVSFVGNKDAGNMGLFYAPTGTLNLLDNNLSTSQGTMFMVYHYPDTTWDMPSGQHMLLYREANSSGDGIQFRRLSNSTTRLAIGSNSNINASKNYQDVLSPTITSYKGNYLNSMVVYRNNDSLPAATTASGTSGLKGLYLGTSRNTSGVYQATFPGYISEVIFYNTNLTAAQFAKIHSYLAIKYGITLSNNSTSLNGNGNYVSSAGSTIWDAMAGAAYHNDVIGIGRDNDQELLQKQSHSYDDSIRIYVGTLAASNVANTGTITADKSYVMIGHNQAPLCYLSGNMEYPAGNGIVGRLDREWKINRVAFTDTVNLDITLNACALIGSINPADLRLLVDYDDGNFINATVFGTAAGVSFSLNGSVLTVKGISNTIVPAGAYLTVASVNSATPLPVKFISFTAKAEGKNKVLLEWNANSDNGFSTFEVEKSTNTLAWEVIGQIPSAVTGATAQKHQLIDNAAYAGKNYYRIHAKDFAGASYYSGVEMVDMKGTTKNYFAYPNPARDKVFVKMENVNAKDVRLYSLSGKDVSPQVSVKVSGSVVEIDISKLPGGSYLVKVNKEQVTFIK